MYHQKYECYRYVLPLKKLSWLYKYYARENVATSKMYILRKGPGNENKQHF